MVDTHSEWKMASLCSAWDNGSLPGNALPSPGGFQSGNGRQASGALQLREAPTPPSPGLPHSSGPELLLSRVSQVMFYSA